MAAGLGSILPAGGQGEISQARPVREGCGEKAVELPNC